jgi:hypothetical protein
MTTVIHLPCFWVAPQEIADLFGEYFQCAHVRDSSLEDFVVDDGVEDSSTVLLIQLEEETVEQGILAFDTPKGRGPNGISPLILKKIVLVVMKPLAVLFNLSLSRLSFFSAGLGPTTGLVS